MGAALTYARRYALFTLVGIAGEDDLDAPDLCDGPPSSLASPTDHSIKPKADQAQMPPRMPGNERGRGTRKPELPVALDPEQSAAMREKLLAEVGNITSADLAAAWAREALTVKNSLTAEDAKLVEDTFEQRLSELPSTDTTAPSNDDPSLPQIEGAQVIAATERADPGQVKGIDKSILAVAAPRRYRNREHLRYVAQQACLVCGRKPSDPHHLGFTQPRALGKVSDEFAVPLCRGHHRAAHRSRDERAWWRQMGIDPIKVARRFWKQTHGMGQRRSRRVASVPRPHGAAAPSDPNNEDVSATTATQEETRLPDLPG